MSDYDDDDDLRFVEEIVKRSEKFVCTELAKMQKEVNGLKQYIQKLEERVRSVENDNTLLDLQLQTFQNSTSQCHQKCLTSMTTAFSAALNTVFTPDALASSSQVTSGTVPITSTPTLHLSDTYPPEEFQAKRIRRDTNTCTEMSKSTSQIYTDEQSLPMDLLAKLGPYLKGNKYATMDKLNPIQRAFVKYKVNEMVATNSRISTEFVMAMIREGVSDRIWREDFKPSEELSLEKYVRNRLKNEIKAVNKEKLVASTDQRMSLMLGEASRTDDDNFSIVSEKDMTDAGLGKK